jgi:uncharacterized protein (TIGR00297 family)
MDAVGGRLVLGLILSLAIGILAYRRGSLTRSGIVGAVLTGTLVFGFGGWVWGGTLVAFFVSSSLLSHYREAEKGQLSGEWAKGSRRDIKQTLANGGIAALLAAVVGVLGKDSGAYPFLALAFFGAMAAVNADTWATELGVLTRATPRIVTTGATARRGTSGAVTPGGTAAALAGAAFIGLVAFVLVQGAAWVTLGQWLLSDWILIPVAAVSGFAGSLVDSFLGATVQASYQCPRCGVTTEHRVHRCGQPTRLERGLSWLDNDAVNLAASVTGASIGALMAMVVL